LDQKFTQIRALALKQHQITSVEVRRLIRLVSGVFVYYLRETGHDPRQILRITTKFRDAGRRSAPWRPTSSRVPGRPQDGNDGNRINRWLLPPEHKFYADEITATLVEIKYFLQALSMEGGPSLPEGSIQTCFSPWLIEHEVRPGLYLDPIQKISIQLHEVVNDARIIQSGHLDPLDRGGKHHPNNTFLMLSRSNQLQGNLTLTELLHVMEAIVARHKGLHV